jgi:hypothetical protein
MNVLTNDNSDNESFIDPYNFPKNESKEARMKRETAFLKLLAVGQEKAQKKHPFHIAIPESWLDYLSPEYRPSWTHASDKHIVYLSSCLSDPQTIVDKMTSIGQLAMLSFATGAKHTLQLFHNVTNIHGNLVALMGISNTSNAYIVDKTKLFKLRTKDLPDLDTITNLDLSRLSSKRLQKPNLVSTPIPATTYSLHLSLQRSSQHKPSATHNTASMSFGISSSPATKPTASPPSSHKMTMTLAMSTRIGHTSTNSPTTRSNPPAPRRLSKA